MKFSVLIASLVLAGLAALPIQAQITNGSFENGNFTGVNDNGDTGSTRLFAGDTNITGWTIIGELAWIQSPNNFGLTASDNNRFLDLTGYNNSAPYGSVEQTINTTIGTNYDLTFDVGVDNDNPLLASPASLTATAGSTSQTFANNSNGPGNQWQHFSLHFIATGITTLIRFRGVSGIDYIGLDNIAVTPTTMTGPAIASLTINPTTVVGGFETATATLTLAAPTPKGPYAIGLVSSDKSAIVPSSVVLGTGQKVKTFPIYTASVNKDTLVTITATANGNNTSANLTVGASFATKLAVSFAPAVIRPNTGYPRNTLITIIVTLTDSSGKPLANEPVSVVLDTLSTGQKSGFLQKMTDDNGQVQGPYVVPTDTRQYNIYVEPTFSRQKPYRASSTSRRIPIG